MPNESDLQTISDAALINPPLTRPVAPDDPVSFIPMADVSDTGQWVGRQTRRQHEVSVGYTSFEERDVLFAKITPCMENGKGCHAIGLLNGVGYGSTEFHVLRAKPGTNDRFLYHWSVTDAVRKKAEAFMIGSAGQQRVQVAFFDHFRIPRLGEDEQRCGAQVLDAADDAITKTETLIAKLKAIKGGLLHDVLTQGLDDNGELRDPDKHPEQFKDTLLGRLPRAWDLLPLKQRAGVFGGKRLPSGHAYTEADTGLFYLRVIDFYYRTPDIGSMMRIERRTFDILSRYEIRPGEVFISIAGSLGYAGEFNLDNGARTILTENAARIVPDGNLRPGFLAAQINGPLIQPQINQQKGISSGVPKLALHRIQNLLVVTPSPDEQERIVDAIMTCSTRIKAEEACLSRLKSLKKGLMQDLLTGRVRIPAGKVTASATR